MERKKMEYIAEIESLARSLYWGKCHLTKDKFKVFANSLYETRKKLNVEEQTDENGFKVVS